MMHTTKKKEFSNSGGLGPLSFSMNSLVKQKNDSESLSEQNRTVPTTNSLNRRLKRKAEDRDTLCRSWGAMDDDSNKDFWASIQEPYHFIMSSHLVPDVCETNEKNAFPAISEMDLSWDMDDVSPSYVWDFSRFLDQYNELYEWLIQVQVELYNPSTFNDKQARVTQQEELQRKSYRKTNFVKQGDQVAKRYPSKSDEISWRVNYLSNKWEQLETTFTPSRGSKPDKAVELDLEHEEKVLKDWLVTMEGHIQPITCRLPKGCSIRTLQERDKDNQILLKDVEAHGPIVKDIIRQHEARTDNGVTSVVDQGPDKAEDQAPNNVVPLRQKAKRIPRRVRCLEKRWHQIYLRSLEWHYYLEGVIGNFKNYPASCSSESEDEPVTKCRKLSFTSSVSSAGSAPRAAKGWSDYENNDSETGSYIEDDYVKICNSPLPSPSMVNPECESLRLQPMLVEEHLDCIEKFENDPETGLSERIPERVQQDLSAMKDKDRIKCNVTDTLSSLTSVERSSPNCGIFEYKHRECDVVVARSVGSPVTTTVTPSRLRPATRWKNRQRSKLDDAYVDEDAVQRGLQRIIDEAILEQDWLNSNIPTDSEEGSVGSRPELVEDRMDTNSETSVGKSADVCDSTSIEKLIEGAEKIARCTEPVDRANLEPLPLNATGDSKQRRIRQWITQQTDSSFQDSCDASGELTTGESDVESEGSDRVLNFFGRSKHFGSDSVSSVDKTPTVESLRAFSSSTPKLYLRGKKRRQNDQRPWSITDVAEIPLAHNPQELEFLKRSLGQKYDEAVRVPISIKSFSSSESALNHLKGSSSDTAVEGRTPTNANCDQIGESVEETVVVAAAATISVTAEEGTTISSPAATSGDATNRSLPATSSLKKRKARFRRKSNASLGRRTLGSESDESTKKLFGKVEQLTRVNQFASSTELPDLSSGSPIKQTSLLKDEIIPVTKSSESSLLEVLRVRQPQLSPRFRVRTPTSDLDGGTAPEDIGPLPEQAWDSYQDTKYLSEPYSEDVDHDAARRLLDFGDDYRKYIDSDGSSLIGRPPRPSRIRKPLGHGSAWSTSEYDSDSDLESIHQMLNESKTQLYLYENAFRRCCGDHALSIDLQVVIATATNHLEALKKFIRALQKDGLGLETEMKDAKEIVRRWETLQAEAVELQRQVAVLLQLQKEMKAFKLSLDEIGDHCENSVRLSSLDTPVEFQRKIAIAKECLATAVERREDLAALNLSVHTFLSDSNLVTATLKEEMADLYQLWDETQLRINGKISKLEGAETIWRLWEEQKTDLQKLLNQDSHTLKILDKAMQSGDMTDLMASNAQDVARLLNEKRNIGLEPKSLPVSNVNTKSGDLSKLRSFGGGHMSDSATSGYESCSSDDLSERERRLAHLRRLARDLEATLVPGSKAYSDISETIADAEKQLGALQKQCRELLVRSTGTTSDDNEISHPEIENLSSGFTARTSRYRTKQKRLKNNNTWIWRIVRTAIPLQAALLLLLCVACLLEPNCCDSTNTLNFNISPQLRFINGPPPV